MNRNNIIRILLSAIMLFITDLQINSQNPESKTVGVSGDSLSLKDIIDEVVKNHPAVNSAKESINYADARISLAKTGYNPQIDMNVNYSNLGPVTKLTIPDMGTFQLFPDNNYSAALNYRQVIYDFGRTKQSIVIETEGKNISEYSLEQLKQKLAMAAVNNFYALLFLQAAVRIKDEQLIILNEHLSHIEKMKSTGSATEYQILSTKVKISGIESQKTDILSALRSQQSFLISLLGMNGNINPVVKSEFSVLAPILPGDSLLSYAYMNRYEIMINREKSSLAEMKYELVKTMNKPVVNFLATGGAKNGYVPDLEKIRPNYMVGVGITIPIFDGRKTKYNLAIAESGIKSLSYESENTKRTVTNEVREAEENMYAAAKKISQYELQVSQALKAYSLAEVSFNAGTITNLDLLDAGSVVSESRLLLLKARIDYSTSIYRLKAGLGEKFY